MLDQDALLNVFYILRLDLVNLHDDVVFQANWNRVRWWYKPTQVCGRWRHLILASPVRLDLHLVCTYGTPVADMLAHSPPLPLVINYLDIDHERTPEDDDHILLALQHCHRVRRIGLVFSNTNFLQPLMAMNKRFPILERLFIRSRTGYQTNLMVPETFQAPSLRGLVLSSVALPTRSPFMLASTGLVILVLECIPPSAYFPPSYLLARLSSLTQLQTLSIGFSYPAPADDVEGHMSHTQTMAQVTLPSLRSLFLHGGNAYLEALFARMNTPQLEIVHVWLFPRFTFNFQHLSQFAGSIKKPQCDVAWLRFYPGEVVLISPKALEGDWIPFRIQITCTHLDWQVASAIQAFGAIAPMLSVVELLELSYYPDHDDDPSERFNEVDPTHWCELLRPFRNVKTLSVGDALAEELSISLRRASDRGEPSLERWLPKLRELRYSGGDRVGNGFAPFIHARQTTGQPVNLVRDSGQGHLFYHRREVLQAV